MADPDQGNRRVELVETSTPSGSEAGRTGLGLIIGLVVGRSSLLGAATGSEQFDVAIAHFVGVVLASVAGVLLLGVLYDQARRSTTTEDHDETTPTDDSTSTPSELPIGASS